MDEYSQDELSKQVMRPAYCPGLISLLISMPWISLLMAGSPLSLVLPAPDQADFHAPVSSVAESANLKNQWTDTAPAEGAPVISEWNKSALPGESLTLTGARFTSADGGKDATAVWIQAGGSLLQAQVWILEENLLTVSLPDDIEPGQYFLWVQNREGISSPVALNRTLAQWIGPLGDRARAGERKRIFGRNLSLPGTSPVVLLTPADGGEGVSLPVTSATPYALEFEVPATTLPGKYTLRASNGSGGGWGWSAPLSLEVRTPAPTGKSVRVAPAEAANLQPALNDMTTQPEGGTVELEAGIYLLDGQLIVRPGVRLVGRGPGQTILRGAPVFLQAPPDSRIEIRDLTIEQGLRCDSEIRNKVPHDMVNDVWIENVELLGTPHLNLNGNRIAVINSRIPVIYGIGTDSWFMGNVVTGQNPAASHRWAYQAAVYSGNGLRSVVEKNRFRNEWPMDENGKPVYWIDEKKDTIKSWYVRLFLSGSGVGGFDLCYLGENHGENIAGQINKDPNVGEMILLHSADGSWFGSVASSSDTTVELSQEPIRDAAGEALKFQKMQSGGPVRVGENFYLVIIHGPGLGQARRIVSYTPTSVTVDTPWRVSPQAGSRAVITPLYRDNIIFKNDISAFAEGFPLEYSKAQGISLFGNCWNTAVDGTITRRAFNAEVVHGRTISPSYWNEIRNGLGKQIYFSGAHIGTGLSHQPNLAGATTLGNMIRKGNYEITGPWITGRGGPMLRSEISQHSPTTPRSELPAHLGNVIEYMNVGGGKIGIGSSRHSKGLFRRNILSLSDDPNLKDIPEKRGISLDLGSEDRFFENRFANAATYAAGFEFMHYAIQDTSYRKIVEVPTRKPLLGRLTLLNHVARFRADQNSLAIPVANTGLAPLKIRIVSVPDWLSVKPDQAEIGPETAGTFDLTIDRSKLPKDGPRSADIVLEANDGEARVGVCVEQADPGLIPSQSDSRQVFGLTPYAALKLREK